MRIQLKPSTEQLTQSQAVTSAAPRPARFSSVVAALRRTGAIVFGILFSLIVIEVGFRVMEVAAPKHTVWRDRPHWYYLPESSPDNRDRLALPAKAEGVFRIIVVGDSFTVGGKGQFDDAFSERLERMLNLNIQQRPVEVLNWGIPGYSTAQELSLVKRAVESYHPDLIILEITLNDPELAPYRVTHPNQKASGEIVLTNPIFSYWKSLAFFVQRILNARSHREYAEYYFDLFDNPATWNNFSNALHGIQRTVQMANVPLLSVVFPLFSHPLDKRYPFITQHRKISARLKELGIPGVDLLPAFRNIPPERLQVMPGEDSHPNEIAHRIAADRIYQTLVRRNLIPEDVRIKKSYKGGRPLQRAVPPA
jgi:lysophospholipase L1-like esterase